MEKLLDQKKIDVPVVSLSGKLLKSEEKMLML